MLDKGGMVGCMIRTVTYLCPNQQCDLLRMAERVLIDNDVESRPCPDCSEEMHRVG